MSMHVILAETAVPLQVQCQLIRIAWALIVLREWEHPLLRQVMSCLSTAAPPKAPSPATQAAATASPTDDTAARAVRGLSEDIPGGVAALPTAEEEEEQFRGATGGDRREPLRRLPRFALLQLAQCVLLASAAGEADLVALLPEHLRRSCGAAWRGARLSCRACICLWRPSEVRIPGCRVPR